MPARQHARDAEAAGARLAGELEALIVAGDRDAIMLVAPDDLHVSAYDELGALPASDEGFVPALIVVSVTDTVAAQLGIVETLVRRFDQAPLVLVCPRVERWEVRALLGAGVAGVVVAGEMTSTLDPCIRAVRSGQTCVPRAHSAQIEPPALSAREKQILGLVVMGYMNGQIAEKLVLAESTVKSHLSSAFGKLGVRSRNEAVELILNPERGLGMGILALGASAAEPPHALN